MDNTEIMDSPASCAVEASGADQPEDQQLSGRDIRRNMMSLVLLETTFWTGSADINLALQPLLVYLGASNTMIGWVNGVVFAGLVGVVFSPWITKRFPYKKWYLFVGNVPYLTAIAVMGMLAVFNVSLGMSKDTLLWWVFGLYFMHWFFGGFVTLPCTEYIAACIPMSHRGRLTGYAYSAAGGTAIGAAFLGKYILKVVPKPASFGYVLLLGWVICQLGYMCMLFAKERRTPVEKSPPPYSKGMFTALLKDRAYVSLLVLYFLYTTCFYTTTFNFVNIYGFKELHMPLWTSATMIIIAQLSKLLTSAPMGLYIDKLSPKRTLPYIFFIAAASWLAPIVIPAHWGVYAGVALGTICVTGLISAQTALICGLPSPEHRAGHFTIQIVLMYAALTLGPITIGALCDLLPFKTVFGIMTVVSLVFFPVGRVMLRGMPDDVKSYN